MQSFHIQPRRRRRKSGRARPLRMFAALMVLALGASLAWLSQLCLSLGRAWAGEQAAQRWGEALGGFRASPEPPAVAPGWERQLLRIGPSVLVAIGGALVMLWTLLLLGGALVWLALHGYGFYLLLATISLGTLLGSSMALTRRARGSWTQRDRLN